MGWKQVEDLLAQAVLDGVFPAACALVGSRKGVLFEYAAGHCSLHTVFDVASLTKAVVTTTLTMIAVERGLLTTEYKASRWLNGVDERITVGHLLNHSSGKPDWKPYYKRPGADRQHLLMWACEEPTVYEPGTQSVYSDLGFIMLGAIVEQIGGASLDCVASQEIFEPLKMKRSCFLPLNTPNSDHILNTWDIAPTETCTWRLKTVRGEVHDDNAYVMGGIAGHAGLFSSVLDLHIFSSRLVDCYHSDLFYLQPETLRYFWTTPSNHVSTWRLGWDSPSVGISTAGSLVPADAVGHLGFTGCSLWIAPNQGIWVILLSNRVHPSRDNWQIKEFRPRFHDAVWKTLMELQVL